MSSRFARSRTFSYSYTVGVFEGNSVKNCGRAYSSIDDVSEFVAIEGFNNGFSTDYVAAIIAKMTSILDAKHNVVAKLNIYQMYNGRKVLCGYFLVKKKRVFSQQTFTYTTPLSAIPETV